MNLYAYVGNSPIHYVDPSGYMKCEEKGKVYARTGEAEVTLKYFLKREFERNANALKELGDIDKLIHRITKLTQPEHVWELQLGALIQ